MLSRSPEMEEERLPIVSLVIVADKSRCPANFVPITKTHDDASDADLWKDGFGFGIFNRSVRYLAVNRHIADTHSAQLEVLTDLAVISDKEAVPSSFICLDFTVDTKEKALKKKYLCARFTPRNQAIDAVSNIIVLGKTRRPPRGYSQAGEIDGMLICFKVTTIPEGYGRLTHSQSTELDRLGGSSTPPVTGAGLTINNGGGLYPNVNRHSTSDLDKVGQKLVGGQMAENRTPQSIFKGIDRVPFALNPVFAATMGSKDLFASLPPIPEWRTLEAKYTGYQCRLERSIVSPPPAQQPQQQTTGGD